MVELTEKQAVNEAWRTLIAAYGTPGAIRRETHCRSAEFAVHWLAEAMLIEARALAENAVHAAEGAV